MIGTLSRTASKRWRRLSTVPWFGAWGDGGCGNVGLGATGPARAALMVGTSGALRTIVPSATPAIAEGLFAQRLGPGTVIGGQLSEGGGTLAWVSRLLGRSQASLERAAANLDPDSHGLTVLPYTFGERGLGYHDDARGSVVGLAPGTDATAVYRAFLESIALDFAAVDDRLAGVLGSIPGIVASGGALEASGLFAQVLADALGRDISVAAGVESSRRGAALLALWGHGPPFRHRGGARSADARRPRRSGSDRALQRRTRTPTGALRGPAHDVTHPNRSTRRPAGRRICRLDARTVKKQMT